MSIRVRPDALEAGCDAMVDLVDVGANAGAIQLWTGTRPGSLAGSPAGDMLVEIEFDDPAFGAASGGVATLAGVPLSGTGVDDGVIGWARIVDADGDPIWDEDDVVAAPASGAVVMSTLTVSIGLTVNLNSYTFTVAPPA